MSTTKYVRTRGGMMIHLSGCERKGRKSSPWPWADHLSGADLRQIVADFPALDLTLCTFCKPGVDRG